MAIRGAALNALKGVLKEAAIQAPAEFGQEAVQEILALANTEYADPNFELLSQQNFKQVTSAGAASMVGGIGGGLAADLRWRGQGRRWQDSRR